MYYIFIVLFLNEQQNSLPKFLASLLLHYAPSKVSSVLMLYVIFAGFFNNHFKIGNLQKILLGFSVTFLCPSVHFITPCLLQKAMK